jgi:hypothetical protein
LGSKAKNRKPTAFLALNMKVSEFYMGKGFKNEIKAKINSQSSLR